jgi:predicted 2-oxoglutarate/Fe(II)-dependent dioxygenase YbiX
MSVNLSNPEEYENGDLVVFYQDKEIFLEKEAGSYIIFPAILYHEVKTITHGNRDAIVTWTRSKDEIVESINKEILRMENTNGKTI